jgi:hypothetical protein
MSVEKRRAVNDGLIGDRHSVSLDLSLVDSQAAVDSGKLREKLG